MQNHNPSHGEILEATDLLLRMDAVDTEILPLRSPERYGFSSGFPDLNDAWARYYPAIDALAVRVEPWLLSGNTELDVEFDTEELLEKLRAQGWEIDDVREAPFVKKPSDSDVHDVRSHESMHVDLHKLSWWWMKIAFTNCHANMRFYNVLQAFQYRPDDLVDEVTDLLAFEWNSRRLLYAVLPLHEAVATISGAINAPGDTTENIDQAIEKRKQLLTLFSMEKKQLTSVVSRLDKEEQKAKVRRTFQDVLQADEPLDQCPISLRHRFPTFSITDIQENKREWRICQKYYEIRALTAGKKLIEEFDNDPVVREFIPRIATAASDRLSHTATTPIPPSIIPPSNRFLEALDIVASYPEYYKRVITSSESKNSQEVSRKTVIQASQEAYRLLSWLGLAPVRVPYVSGPIHRLEEIEEIEKLATKADKFRYAIYEQLMVVMSQRNPLFMIRVANDQCEAGRVSKGIDSQEINYCKLNFWITVLRWLFIESLEQKHNKIDSPVLDEFRPVDADECIESAVGIIDELQQNDQLDLVIEQGRDKLHSLEVPSHADPLVP